MNIAFQLYQLQHIDSEMDRASARLLAIEDSIKKNSLIASAEKSLEEAKTVLVTRTNDFNHINDQIEKLKIKKNQSQSSLYSGKIQNPKELEDLQLEITSLEKSIGSLEETSMQALVSLDQAEKNLETAKDKLTKARSEFATELSMLNAEKEKLKQNLEGLNAKREPIYDGVDSRYQAQYDNLRKRKNGIAVTRLSDNSCEACGANLTASQQQSARSSQQLFICPNCGRIIYGSQ